ncbi:hypothetical protein FS837_003042 [Tulasnella sp. UAMH 9824]|nr:hypothetical protein FS837_003042 [Tulasnella sp. UAMH 9824]
MSKGLIQYHTYVKLNKILTTSLDWADADVIIVFKDDVPEEQVKQRAQEIIDGGGEVKEWFTPILNGFSATLKQGQFENFRGNDSIKYIEGDQRVSIQPI